MPEKIVWKKVSDIRYGDTFTVVFVADIESGTLVHTTTALMLTDQDATAAVSTALVFVPNPVEPQSMFDSLRMRGA